MSDHFFSASQFNLEGIQPAPRGSPQVEVAFDIDNNGILNVSARDVGTGKEQKVRIESSSGISSADVEKMRKEAESHAEDDRRKRELIDARNQADQMIYQIEKLLEDNADKLSEGDQAPVQAAVEKVREAMKQDDVQAIRRAIEDLKQASNAMAQHMQSQQTASAGPGPAAGGARNGRGGQSQEDVIDADFEVKK